MIILSKIQTLWNNWNKYDELHNVYRGGFLKVKGYGFGDEEKELIDKYHIDDDAAHSYRVGALFTDMMDLWPSYFKKVDKYKASRIAYTHDIGELSVGDICDDGCKEHDAKKAPEWGAVLNHYINLPEQTYLEYKDLFRQFESAKTFVGQAIKMADKFDFLAKVIKMEGQGYHLDNAEYYGKRDIELAEEIGSYKFIDIIGNSFHHLLVIDYRFDQRLVQIGTGLVTCALNSINHPLWKWWRKGMDD